MEQSLYSIASDYSFLDSNMAVALVPIKDFTISEKYIIDGNINIYPKHTLDTSVIQGSIYDFSFQEIKDIFYDATIIAFPIVPPQIIITGSLLPSVKDELIKKALNQAEEIINVFRYIYSNFDKVSNLPQRAGYIKGNLCGFLLFSIAMQAATFISVKNYVTSQTIGNSLNVNVSLMKPSIDYIFSSLYKNNTVISNIIKHALRLYSDILYLPTVTNKFMQAMTLVDYLGNPFEYQKMQKNKAQIAPFSADSFSQYNFICERFKYLTSKKDEHGKEIGLRTNIIHNGQSLESLIFEGYKIDLVLRELQLYICNFINGILDYCPQNDWSYIETKIEEKRNSVQAIPTGYSGKFECDSVIIIDFNFLNQAIKEVYQLYPQYIDRKFELPKFLQLILVQCDIDRPDYQIPVNFIYSKDDSIYNANTTFLLSQYDGLGFQCLNGELCIYAKKIDEDYDNFLTSTFKHIISEKNYFYNDGTKYTNIVLISDYNEIPDEYFIAANNSCKTLTLGRLDNKRTRCYDSCLYFDITYLIMTTLGIELYEDCTPNFIFNPPRYPDA
ncbi:MAG: hypothetical protein HFJ09_10605 [Lachnospiraceae bacterium]|nr:hypothetical protein [Lachnospiraceae bacterium]